MPWMDINDWIEETDKRRRGGELYEASSKDDAMSSGGPRGFPSSSPLHKLRPKEQ